MTAVAIATSELQQWGCPYCGYRSGSTPIQSAGTAVWRCGDCDRSCYVLAPGLTEASFGVNRSGTFVVTFGNRGGELSPPETGPHARLQPHPRAGIPSHGWADRCPISGGEYFRSRGIGSDRIATCFVCGCNISENYAANISAFVECKEAGERVVAMFAGRARLDFREREPDRVQVKVGACQKHQGNLDRLDGLVERKGVLTMIEIALAVVMP